MEYQLRVNQSVEGVSMECQSSIDQVSIEYQLSVKFKGIDQHLTKDAFSTHDPLHVRAIKFRH